MEEVQRNLEKIFRYFLSSYKISRSNHQKKKEEKSGKIERSNISRTRVSKGRRKKSGGRKKRTGKEKIIKLGVEEIFVENATKPRKLRNCHEPLLTRRRCV